MSGKYDVPTGLFPHGTNLASLIRADQLAATRRAIPTAVRVNMAIGFACLMVAVQAGYAALGIAWYAASTVVNLLRLALCRTSGHERSAIGRAFARFAGAGDVDRELRSGSQAAFASGCVWAGIAFLCDGYTNEQTLFYVAVACGITAGAATHGTAYARIAALFITPPLLAVAGCLVASGTFDRVCLAVTTLIYLVVLARGTFQGEGVFREASRLKHEATALARSLELARDRATRVANEMSLRATQDSLTGILNRAGFMQQAEQRLDHAKTPVCLMLLDLDGFKSLNDSFGHAMGDRTLREVARRLSHALPDGAIVARLGGDEFAVLYDVSAEDEAPTRLADRLIATVVQPFEMLERDRVGISIGIHVAQAETLAETMIFADEALYAAKAAGRSQSCLFDHRFRKRLEMRRDGERDLPQALAERALEVWFQPIFGGPAHEIDGFEALLRWHHPKHGWVAPPDVISAAAMAGVAEPLLQFIAEEACRMHLRLRDLRPEPVRISVNVSPRELAHIAVDTLLLTAVSRFGLQPSAIEVEITEETAMDVASVRDTLSNLSTAGFRLAIDDFGVGFSSLSCLRQLRADRLKIDRSFVTGLRDSQDNQLLVRAILGLGRSMGIEVVAEGVETIDDMQALHAAGCRFMQGYHLGRPMPADDAVRWLEQSRSVAA